MSDLRQQLADLSPEKRKLFELLLRQTVEKKQTPTTFPLSFAQQRLWFLNQLEPGSPIYNLPIAMRLSGTLNLAALRRSFDQIAQRHAIVRATFALEGNQPVQRIAPSMRVALPLVSLTALPEARRESAGQQLINAASKLPFDLAAGPLLRPLLVRLNRREHVLLVNMHHIVSDGWSGGVLLRELMVLYSACIAGRASPLPPLPLQYTDYVISQRRRLQGAVLEGQLAYWRQQLAGISALHLPTDHPRPNTLTAQTANRPFVFNSALTADLKKLSQREGVTLFMALLAGFATLLSRYSGQSDFCIGSFVANRNQAEIEGLIGFFVNNLAIRMDLSGGAPARTLLQHVRGATLGAYDHQDVPIEQVIEALQPDRRMSHTPLFQVMCTLQNFPVPRQTLPTLRLEVVKTEARHSGLDLTLWLREEGQQITGELEYRPDLFEPTTIVRMIGQLRVLLEGIIAEPAQRITALPILTRAERHQLLVAWNDARSGSPVDACVHELVEAQAERTPDATAVVYADQHLSYAELSRRADRLAHELRALGVGPENCVATCLERSLDLLVGLLGILKAGGAYVPLDPEYPRARMDFILADTRATVLLTQQRLLPSLPEGPRILCVDENRCSGAAQPGASSTSPARPDQLAYIIYTSGSTGQPKGVMVSHGALANYTAAALAEYSLAPHDRLLQFASASFDASAEEIYPSLACGAALLLRTPEMLDTPAAFLRTCRAWKLTVVNLPTAYWHELAAHMPGDVATLTAAIHLLIIGGEQALPSRVNAWRTRAAQRTRLVNTYGPTETTIVATRYDLSRAAIDGERDVPIGTPVPNALAYIFDRALQPAPIGVPGELYIGGAGVARGYLDRPGLTAERFVPNPFARMSGIGSQVLGAEPSDTRHPIPDTRLYRTGDLARYREDGAIEFLGRIDGQVKIRGFRIELGEVEAALIRHPAVRNGAVVAREDAPGNLRLVAYVVPASDERPTTNDERPTTTDDGRWTMDDRSDAEPSSIVNRLSSFASELRAFLKERLPAYMTPSAFVVLDALPLTASGKVDRRALPAPAAHHSPTDDAFVAPRTPQEELLAAIWRDVLGATQIGVHDNFFALGGHSLLATQVIARVRDAFQIELPLRELFEHPTVSELARALASGQHTTVPPIVPAPRTGALPLSFAQQRLWFLDQLTPGNAAYNIPIPVRLSGTLDLAALVAGFRAILQRHETLRTSFVALGEQPIQRIAASLRLPYALLDLQMLPSERRAAVAAQLGSADAGRPFDLRRGPLLRVTLLRLDAHEHVALLTMHHIISDAWSIGVLLRELATFYRAALAGEPARLPALPVQYADYAIWQRQWLRGAALEAQLVYWKRSLAGLAPLELPSDHPRPPVQSLRGAQQTMLVPEALRTALQALGQREGVTLFMTLLAAFQILLQRYSGQSDFGVGSPIAGRTQRELEDLIGFFINTLVLRADLRGDPAVRDLLARVRGATLDAYAHQDLPFELIVDALESTRDLSRAPLVQVMFVLQNTPMPAQQLPQLTLRPAPISSETAKFDLSVSFMDTAEGLVGTWEYSTDLFEAPTIRRMRDHFQALLEGIVADLAWRLSDLPLLNAAERQQLLFEWNDTGSGVRSQESGVRRRRDEACLAPTWLLNTHNCIHELVEAQAAYTPDAVAIVFDTAVTKDEGRTASDCRLPTADCRLHVTYSELDARANQLAHYLQALGVGPESSVAIALERSVALVLAALAVLKAGGAYVPIDPAYPPERLGFMLADSGARVLVTNDERRMTNDTLSDKVTRRQGDKENGDIDDGTLSPSHLVTRSRRTVDLEADWPVIARQPRTPLQIRAHPDQLAYAIYTSGSTGLPKGVLITHRSLHNLVAWHQHSFGVTSGDRATLLAGVGFDAAVWELWPYLTGGASLQLPDPDTRAEPARLRDWLLTRRITISFVPTPLTEALLALDWPATSALRYLLTGGDRLRQSPRPGLPFTLVNNYGPTEYTVVATTDAVPPVVAGAQAALPSIGRPISNTLLYVLNARLQPVPRGAIGELCLSGVSLARGYLNRPELTAEQFVPNPFSQGSGGRSQEAGARSQKTNDESGHLVSQAGSRLYRTGDLVRYRANGQIEFVGRRDGQVKLRGFRIELDEIAVVLGQHPAVQSAVVLAHEALPGDTRLVAYIVRGSEVMDRGSGVSDLPIDDERRRTNDERSTSEDRRLKIEDSDADRSAPLSPILYPLSSDLRSFLAQRLPDYMIPAAFVQLGAMPLTANGKIDQRALPKPADLDTLLDEDYVAPRTPVEASVADLIAQILGLARVGAHDNFFALGGHSLLATQLIARLRTAFQVDLAVRVLFEAPTTAGLAARIDEVRQRAANTGDQSGAAPQGAQTGPRPIAEAALDSGQAARREIASQALSLRPVPHDGPLPLSFAQQRIWFLSQLQPDSPLYSIPAAVKLSGRVEIGALPRCFAAIIRRHAILRTTFGLAHGQPAQVVAPERRGSGAAPLQMLDLTALPQAGHEAAVQRLANAEARRPFDLTRGPLLRGTLVRLSLREHVLLVNMHHIAADGWSIGIFMSEFAALYDAFSQGRSANLPPLALQYADYATWQREWLGEEQIEQQLTYWRRQLADVPPVLELPTDRPRPSQQSYRGAQRSRMLPPTLGASLVALSQRAEVTPFMILLAGFVALQQRYTERNDIVVGSPIAGRTHEELEPLIGCFINTLVLRTRLSANLSFDELLERVRETCLDAYAHQELPFERLVEALAPSRELSYAPLVQVLFVLQNAPRPRLEFPEVTLQLTQIESGATAFDLALIVTETEAGMMAVCNYNIDLFDQTTIVRLLAHFQTLLQGCAAAPERRLAELPLLSAVEQHQVLIEWNAELSPYPADAGLHQLIEAQAARTPDAVALIYAEQHLTYRALNAHANRLARRLRARGLGAEDVVGMALERSLELVLALLAVWKAGGAYLPLDPTLPRERISFMLEDSGAAIVLVATSELFDKVTGRQGDKEAAVVSEAALSPAHLVTSEAALSPAHLVTLSRQTIDLRAEWAAMARERADNLDGEVRAGQLAYLIYTSGTTGRPKAVHAAHGNLLPILWASRQRFGFSARDVMPWVAAPVFDIALFELLTPLLAGGATLLVPRDEVLELPRLLATLRRCTVLHTVPSLMQQLVQAMPSAAPGQASGGHLRALFVGGDRVPPKLLGQMLAQFPRAEVWVLYGPTEATILSTSYRVAREQPPIGHPIGAALPFVQVQLLDAGGHPAPLGVPGELYLGGLGVTRGYRARPDLTAERFVPNPFAEVSGIGYRVSEEAAPNIRYPTPGTRLYRTGDRARWLPSGVLEYLGRRDGQVKLRGFRIELGEVEAALRRHPAVRDAALAIREDIPTEPRLIAYIVQGSAVSGQRSDDSASETLIPDPRSLTPELRDFLATSLPSYMLPSAFVLLGALPLNANGKLDRNALPAPELAAASAQNYVAPRTLTEQQLAAIWQELLHLPRLSVHDNFFALGGHSLLATQVIARIRETLGVELPLLALFEAPTVAALATRLALALPGANPERAVIPRASREQPLPLSFAQQRLWFLDQLQPGQPTYIIPAAVQLAGPLDVGALRAGLSALIARHETLRTTIALRDDQAVQVIHPARSLSLPLIDLAALPEQVRPALARRVLTIAAWQPLDLERGPLFRAALLRLAAEEHILLLVLHHIIADGWSMGVLLRDLAALYAAAREQQPPDLPELAIQYGDYALWQRQWLHSQAFGTQLDYWRRTLAGAPALLDLPLDRPRPPLPDPAAGHLFFALPAWLMASIEQRCREQELTTFMLLLAALQLVLARSCAQEDIVVGTPIANRTQRATEELIGCFVNTLVLRTELWGNPTLGELLGRVRAVCQGAYAHQELPFERLVEELQPERELSRNPLFQVMFALQNAPMEELAAAELRLEPLAMAEEQSKFDLSLSLQQTEQGMQGLWEYRRELFDAPTIARLHARWELGLRALLDQPEQRLSELVLLSRAERQQLLVEWNDTAVEFRRQEAGGRITHRVADLLTSDSWLLTPDSWCLHQFFEQQAERTPDAVAVVFDTTNGVRCPEGAQTNDERPDSYIVHRPSSIVHLTYAELDQRANQLAHYLRARGVGPEAVVGVSMLRSAELVIALLAVLKAGGAYVPLDPDYPIERISFMLEDSGAQVLVTNDEGRMTKDEGPFATFVVRRSSFVDLHAVDLRADWPAIAQMPASAPSHATSSANLAYVIYTSGSTGRPKGTMNSHRGIVNRLLWMQERYQLAADDRVLHKTSFSFDVSVWEFFWPLLAGARLVVARPGGHKDSAYLVRLIAEQSITTLHFVPSMLQVFLDERGLERCASLRRVICSGEALPAELQQRFFARLSAELHNLYGPTEAAVDVSAWTCVPASEQHGVPIGHAIANTQLYVLDRAFNPAPLGVAGELYIGGVQLARGYLKRPDLTAAAFLPNPFTTNDERRTTNAGTDPSSFRVPSGRRNSSRLYRTGDLVRVRADGAIMFLGRLDQQVKLRGFRIELDEIAAALRSHEAVREAVVLARADHAEGTRLVAYVVPTNEGRTTKDERPIIEDRRLKIEDSDSDVSGPLSSILYPLSSELRTFLATRLPDYMVPSAFVFLDALPLTTNGKLDRKALPAPTAAHHDKPRGYVAPRTPGERRLVQLWEALLEVRPIGVYDDFFALGGHSLLAMRLVAQLAREEGATLPLSALFQASTVAQLALRLGEPASSETGLLVPIQPHGERPPLICVHPGGGEVLCYAELARLLAPDQPVYGLRALGLDGEAAPHEDVPAMAAYYLDALRQLQPEGPYLLAGWSLGGMIAFEMARQLHAQGETVALLAMIDPSPPQHETAPQPLDEATILDGFAQQLGLVEQHREDDPEARLRALHTQAQQIGLLPPDLTLAQLQQRLAVFAAHMNALQSYVPQPAPHTIALFYAHERFEPEETGPAEAWAPFAADMQVYELPGNHYQLLRPPYVHLLAAQLQARLAALPEPALG